MTFKRSIACLVFLGMALAVPLVVSAHHAGSTEFQIDKEITFTGTITKIFYTNPHTGLFDTRSCASFPSDFARPRPSVPAIDPSG